MRSWWDLALLALISATTAQAGSAPPADRQPEWIKRPSPSDLLEVFPAKALRKQLPGWAIVSCTVTVQGSTRECHVVSESPAGLGFGEAALALTPEFLFRPAIRGGAPTEDIVKIPISFRKPPSSVEWLFHHDVIAGLAWLEGPSIADVIATYPGAARQQRVSGRVDLTCSLMETGHLTRCATKVEHPKGYGFAKAAEELTQKFVGPTKDNEGKPLTGARIQLPFTFSADVLTSPGAIVTPRWISLPTAEDFERAFPAAAKSAGIRNARVVLGCAVGPKGALTNCAVVSEEPGGYGFGDGALQLTDKFRVSAWSSEGLPAIGGAVRAAVRYDLPARTPESPQK